MNYQEAHDQLMNSVQWFKDRVVHFPQPAQHDIGALEAQAAKLNPATVHQAMHVRDQLDAHLEHRAPARHLLDIPEELPEADAEEKELLDTADWSPRDDHDVA